MRPLLRRFEAVPIRWRLALTSAVLTFAILALFAAVVGTFTAQRLREDFDHDLESTAVELRDRIGVRLEGFDRVELNNADIVRVIVEVAATREAAVRVVDTDGDVVAPEPRGPAGAAPELGPPVAGVRDSGPYRAASVPIDAPESLVPVAYLQYGRDRGALSATITRLKLFLGLGVAAGTALALLAGLAVARRAMAPVGRLARAAQEIARTRDPATALPRPAGEDEVADLARTLEQMLLSLDEARGETEAALARQRQFVADASHELRTPLTSVLANLELLDASLRGEDRELAAAALRSSRRMRRLVADLLLLARADAGRPRDTRAVDLGAVLRDVAGELAPLAADHALAVEAPGEPLIVRGSADELHRLVVNLVENAVAHTPAGTRVEARAERRGRDAVLEVADDGPGVPEELRERLFERFVRGAGDAAAGGGTGLGLAIVRAVAERHGGTVRLEQGDGPGARFVVTVPAAAPDDAAAPEGAPAPAGGAGTARPG